MSTDAAAPPPSSDVPTAASSDSDLDPLEAQSSLPEASPSAVTMPPAHPSPKRASTLLLVLVALTSVLADAGSKAWARGTLTSIESKARGLRKITVLKGHVDFIFAQNPGGAWSFLRSLPDSLRRPFFLVVTAIAIVFIISVYRRLGRDQHGMKWGLAFALGGAIGNLVDRVRFGWVVDFIDMYVTRKGHESHWPTYNVADIAICIGVILMGIDMLRSRGFGHDHAPTGSGPQGLPS